MLPEAGFNMVSRTVSYKINSFHCGHCTTKLGLISSKIPTDLPSHSPRHSGYRRMTTLRSRELGYSIGFSHTASSPKPTPTSLRFTPSFTPSLALPRNEGVPPSVSGSNVRLFAPRVSKPQLLLHSVLCLRSSLWFCNPLCRLRVAPAGTLGRGQIPPLIILASISKVWILIL